MTKLSSFLVFAFGIFLIVAIVVLSFKQSQPVSGRPSSTSKAELPQSDMLPLELGTPDQFIKELDKMFASGGLASVRDYVEAEMVPGRLLIYGKSVGGETPRTYRLIDRELRHCDRNGATILNKAPVLARSSAMMKVDDSVLIENWRRQDVSQPYSFTVWWSESGK